MISFLFDEFLSQLIHGDSCEDKDEYDYPCKVEEDFRTDLAGYKWAIYLYEVVERAEPCDRSDCWG